MSDCRLGVLFLLLLGSAVYDVNYHKIPNWLLVEGISIGVFISCWDAGTFEFFYFILRASATMGIFFFLFLFRVMGAGDIKLMGVIAGYLGMFAGGLCIGYSFLIGAVMALCKLLWRRSLIDRLQYFYAYFRQTIHTKEIVAYHEINRDGLDSTIHFSIPLLGGYVIYLIQQYVI